MELLIILGVGLFFLLGTIIVFLFKNNDKVITFSISIAFSVMLALMLFELLPEAYELIKNTKTSPINILILVIGIILGLVIIKLLDLFIPDHHEEDSKNFLHIGLISSIALIVHNIIEGMAIYTTIDTDIEMGLLLCIGVGLHNIPLGMIITSTFYKVNNSKIKTILISILISLSTFIGGLIIFMIKGLIINDLVLGIMLSMTIGMIIYITLLELLPKIMHSKHRTTSIIGIVIGILILILASLIH